MMISQKNSEALKNPWVLGMIAFLLTFLTANALFIYLAFQSPPNLVVQDFYERGERYEETHKRMEQEKAMGWNGVIMAPSQTRVNQHQTYEVMLQGKNATALNPDSVILHAYRPSDARADFSVEMTQVGLGTYAADVSYSLPGIWDIIIVATKDGDEFLVTKRVSISP
ncbi:MAG: FixH family protein [Gammaproteobacteria bacterium]|nr:FixH family protein [Gammaproteobacteria bacterium]